ncbi:hypothetical protein OPT61_g7891 [Boeremia exigua]|uniref:Uncharacterized protein n=1 Tax=Boeremia exigua TaxID=749465 RepID=A0ACC2I1K6_9PLEO|nr:hypothetical protein OPT61_g7891 [Boeremia exigua]
MLRQLFLLGTALGGAYAQALLEALSKVPELSNFTTFYQNNEAFAAAYFGNESSYPITFLAPSNDAFASYFEQFQVSLFDVGPETLLQLVQYHTLVSDLKSENFTNVGSTGLTAPTMLKDSPNNNRSSGVNLAAKFGGPEKARGQVVFIQSAGLASSPNRFKLMSRQSSPQSAGVRSGLASTVNLQTLDADQGTWDGGSFHIVDGLLTLPTTCARTARTAGLASLDNALNRTKLWPSLDGSKNVTCLGPSNAAFQAAGNPDNALDETALASALLFHTLPEVAYSDFLVDGQEFKSLQNGTVRVRVEESDGNRTIWFNNARVIDANVLTHNGLIHVLDAVMVPLEQVDSTPSGTVSSRPSSTATNTASSPGASSNTAPSWKKPIRSLSRSTRCIARCGVYFRPQLTLRKPHATSLDFVRFESRAAGKIPSKPAKKESNPASSDNSTQKRRGGDKIIAAKKASLLLNSLRKAREPSVAAPPKVKSAAEPVSKATLSPPVSNNSGSPRDFPKSRDGTQSEESSEVTLTIDEKEEAIQRRIVVMRRKILWPGIWTLFALAGTYGTFAYFDVRAGVPSSDGSHLPERAQIPQTWYLTPTVILKGVQAGWNELDGLTIGIFVATFAIHLLKRSPLPIWERLIHVTGEAKWTAFTYPLVNSSWKHAAQNMVALVWFLPGVVYYFDGDLFHTSAFLVSVPLITSYVTHFAYRFNFTSGLVLNLGASGSIAAALGVYSVVYANEKVWFPPGLVLRIDAMYWALLFAASQAFSMTKTPQGGNRPAFLVHLASMGLGAAYAYFDMKHHLWIPLVSEISSTQNTDAKSGQ